LTEILSEVDASPSVQEKLKVAFAEGYLANDKKKGDPEVKWNSLPRRALRIGLTLLLFWLAFQLLQTYSALGGSTFCILFLSHIYLHENHITVFLFRIDC